MEAGNQSINSTQFNSQELAAQQITEIMNTVTARRCLFKSINACCLPCICIAGCCRANQNSYMQNPNTNIRYSDSTLCDGGSRYHPMLPPENRSELYARICDVFALCCCCTDESSSQYLLPKERLDLHNAQQQLHNSGPAIQTMESSKTMEAKHLLRKLVSSERASLI